MISSGMENQVMQQKVFAIKSFYTQLLRYVGLNTIGVAIWMLSGGGYFWPIWVILLWGISIAYDAYKLDLLKNHAKYKESIMAITKKWEEEQIKKVKEETETVSKPMNVKSDSKKKTKKK